MKNNDRRATNRTCRIPGKRNQQAARLDCVVSVEPFYEARAIENGSTGACVYSEEAMTDEQLIEYAADICDLDLDANPELVDYVKNELSKV